MNQTLELPPFSLTVKHLYTPFHVASAHRLFSGFAEALVNYRNLSPHNSFFGKHLNHSLSTSHTQPFGQFISQRLISTLPINIILSIHANTNLMRIYFHDTTATSSSTNTHRLDQIILFFNLD